MGQLQHNLLCTGLETAGLSSGVTKYPALCCCQVNSKPLPDVNANLGYGLRLADEAHLLVQPNWRIDPFHDKKKEQQDAGGQ